MIQKELTGDLKLKWDRIQQAMRKINADGCLLTVDVNLYYTTGRIYSGYFYLPAEGAPWFFVKRPNGLAGDHVEYIRKPEQMAELFAIIIVLVMVVAAIGYFFSMLMRFAISRKREYLADAGAAEMTKNPLALASALRKISADPDIEAVKREDVAQLFIQHPGQQAKSALNGLSGLFATHPPIEKRIQVLEQF